MVVAGEAAELDDFPSKLKGAKLAVDFIGEMIHWVWWISFRVKFVRRNVHQQERELG